MINDVVLSGKLVEKYEMSNGAILGKLICDEETFYIFWDKTNFNNEEVENKYICVNGELTHIKYLKEDNKKILRVQAVHVQNMEVVDNE